MQAGEPLVSVHAPEKMELEELEAQFSAAVSITGARKPVPKLILEVMA